MTSITVDQELELFIEPKDSRGNAARVDGDPVWAVSDASVLTLLPGQTPFHTIVRGLGPIGAGLVTVTVDADLGEGVKPLSGSFAVAVVPGEASSLAITAGGVSDIAPAPASEPVSTDTPAPSEATAEVTADPVVNEVVADPVTDAVVTEQPAADPVVEEAAVTEAQPADAATETPAEGGETPAG